MGHPKEVEAAARDSKQQQTTESDSKQVCISVTKRQKETKTARSFQIAVASVVPVGKNGIARNVSPLEKALIYYWSDTIAISVLCVRLEIPAASSAG